MQNLQSLVRNQSSATYSSRGSANLVPNGSFETAPPFTAATTANGVYIDGTADGSAVDDTYTWRTNVSAASMAFQFDDSEFVDGSNSIKVSTTDATGRGYVTTGTGALLLPAEASMAYTVSAFIKTNNVAADGARIFVAYFDSGQSFLDGFFTDALTGTNDWTFIENNFTTHASTAFVEVQLLNHVAGNVSDAWFDVVRILRS